MKNSEKKQIQQLIVALGKKGIADVPGWINAQRELLLKDRSKED